MLYAQPKSIELLTPCQKKTPAKGIIVKIIESENNSSDLEDSFLLISAFV